MLIKLVTNIQTVTVTNKKGPIHVAYIQCTKAGFKSKLIVNFHHCHNWNVPDVTSFQGLIL